MGAIQRTKGLKRVDIPLDLLVKNARNPNKMKSREFDLLVDNIERSGLTDPILVRPIEGGKYRVVGGHHRFDAATYLQFAEVPCTVLPEDFDEDEERFQLVRMNMIRGRMDPNAFFALYQEMSQTYSDEILQDSFGFAEEAEFQKLINQTAKGIDDPAMKEQFKKAAKEIKTIDGLSKLLNEIFTKYGDTLPRGYMVFDHAGQRNVWIQVEQKTMKAIDVLGIMCADHNRTMDDVLGQVVQLIARGDLPDVVGKILGNTPETKLPKGLQVLPTKENLEAVGNV